MILRIINSFPFFIVNTFGKGSQSGNPAAVCMINEWQSTEKLQSLAIQINQPETAFVIPVKKGNWAIRWFSVNMEVDLCGHATLAAAHCLLKKNKLNEIKFSSKTGVLNARINSDRSVSLSLPISSCRPSRLSSKMIQGLGAYPESVWIGDNYLCLFESEDIIQSLQPDFTLMQKLREAIGVIVTAPSLNKDYDFVFRYFAPRIGINEDQATGSAHCMLIPFWTKRLQKKELCAVQLSQRGGLFYGNATEKEIILRGSAEEFITGEIRL